MALLLAVIVWLLVIVNLLAAASLSEEPASLWPMVFFAVEILLSCGGVVAAMAYVILKTFGL